MKRSVENGSIEYIIWLKLDLTSVFLYYCCDWATSFQMKFLQMQFLFQVICLCQSCALVTCWSWVRIQKQSLCICKGKTAYNIPPPYLRIAKSLRAMGYEVFISTPIYALQSASTRPKRGKGHERESTSKAITASNVLPSSTSFSDQSI